MFYDGSSYSKKLLVASEANSGPELMRLKSLSAPIDIGSEEER